MFLVDAAEEQVITTMNFFPRCDFLRVIVATTLFGRLVDLENTDLILDEFTQVRTRTETLARYPKPVPV